MSGIWQQIRIQRDPRLDPHYGHHHGEVGGDATAQGREGGHGTPRGKGLAVAVPMGVAMYIKNFVPAVPLYLWPLMFVLELIGAAVKPFVLAVRLFANMMAGHLILAALVALIPVGVGVGLAPGRDCGAGDPRGDGLLQLLELFVAFLQAYIFTFLSTLFIAAAVPEH